MEYDPAQFRGAAPYYLRGRPPYSPELGAVLARELQLDGTGVLLDVGCGPGTVGLQLAPWFAHVVFAEPDPGMLDEARANAAAAALPAVDFLPVTAEDLPDLGLPPLRVATFGQSFHRTERDRVAEGVYDRLEPGGSMVLVTHEPGRPGPPRAPGTALVPHEQIRRLVRTFLGPELRSGDRLVSSYGTERFEESLARTRFGRPRVAFAPGRPLVRDADSVVANYLSMSYAAPHLFGPRLPEFLAALHALLADHAAPAGFWDWPGDTELVVATRRTAGAV